MLNTVVGTKLKLISGYSGTGEARIALERGEVDAMSQPWPIIKAELPHWLRERKISLLVQTGADKSPGLPDVPRMIDLARNADDLALLALFSSPSTIGRSVVAPPGLPPERVAELRRAFIETMRDPAFLQDVEKSKLDLEPLAGEALQAAIAGSGNFSAELIARAQRSQRHATDGRLVAAGSVAAAFAFKHRGASLAPRAAHWMALGRRRWP